MAEKLPVLVIRAEPGASQTAARLEKLGIKSVLSPVLELSARDEPVPDLSQFAGLILTSANGARFLAEASDDRSLPTWCVGPATASEALRQGYSPVHESSGDAHDLAHYIAHHAPPGSRRLLHVANAAARGALKAELQREGFDVTYLPLYQANAAPALSPEALLLLQSGAPCICLVHSSKGAEAFLGLASGAGLHNIKFVTISEQASAPFQGLETGGVISASHPDEEHLLDLLQRVLESE